jgi:serine/threonine protein kinase
VGDPENRVSDLYHRGLEQTPEERGAFLRDACNGDDLLLAEVESLLRFDGRAAVFLDRRAAAGAGTAVAPMAPRHTMVNQQLGAYRLVAPLGSGGMGEVYRARDTRLRRDVAIKVLPPEFTRDPERLARLEREAHVLAALNHPNIGAIYGLEEGPQEDGSRFRALVLELVEGETLADWIAKGAGGQSDAPSTSAASGQRGSPRPPIAIDQALRIARQIASALEAAHQKGIIHRDVKPSNILLTTRGIVKVLDFGIAKLSADLDPGLAVMDTLGQTREGLIVGTAGYMSPEQARGQVVDTRTDIWSFGCVLYEIFTGRRAFGGETFLAALAQLLECEPDWSLLPAATPPGVRRLLDGCLEKDTSRRLQDIGPVCLELDDLCSLFDGRQPHERLSDSPPSTPAAPATRDRDRRTPRTGATSVTPRVEDVTQLADVPAEGTRIQRVLPLIRNWRLPTPQLRYAAIAALMLGAIVLVERMRVEAQQQQSQKALKVSANYAASAIAVEINSRFARLNELAGYRELRDWLLLLESETEERKLRLREDIELWLGTHRSNSPSQVQGESWFVNDRAGVQIARSPQSSRSTGRNYAHRDYFHGRGRDYPQGMTGLSPIEAPHLSAVYRSTSDGTLRVAFSYPIGNGRSGAAHEVVGVLAMSVDLGEFNVLERRLPPEYEVVLVTLREEAIAGETRRGLVLHHQARAGHYERDLPRWLGEGLLAHIDAAVPAAGAWPREALMLGEYRDPAVTGGRRYRGAMQAVVDTRPDRNADDMRWLVLVQEQLGR